MSKMKYFQDYYRIIGYGLRVVMREFPDKGQKTFGLDNVITKLLKIGCPSPRMEWDIMDCV